MVTVRTSKRPVDFLSNRFLRILFVSSETSSLTPIFGGSKSKKSAWVLDWRDIGEPGPTELPVSLLDILRMDSLHSFPTISQIIDLVSMLISECDSLAPRLYLCISIDSVYITNPSKMGTEEELKFRICPFSTGSRVNLPRNVTPFILARRRLAIFVLHLITRLTSLDSPLLIPRLQAAFSHSPGLITLYTELLETSNVDLNSPKNSEHKFGPLPDDLASRDASNERNLQQRPTKFNPPPPTSHSSLTPTSDKPHQSGSPHQPEKKLLSELKLIEVSPSAAGLSLCLQSEPKAKTFAPSQIPILLTCALCHDRRSLYVTATEALRDFVTSVQPTTDTRIRRPGKEPRSTIVVAAKDYKLEYAVAIGLCTEFAWILVPGAPGTPTGLTDPTSSTRSAVWVDLMYTLDRILSENENSSDYARKRRLQQALIDAGLARQVGGSLLTGNGRFTLKVLVPIVRVSVRASFQFPALSLRLLFDRNVRKMSNMMFDALEKGIVHKDDVNRYVSMMLIMSDFGKWVTEEDQRLSKSWDDLDRNTFLLCALSCWAPNLSDRTTALVVTKLTSCFEAELDAWNNASTSVKKGEAETRLHFILDWLTQFAWNASEQACSASYKSMYASYFVSLIMGSHNTNMLQVNPNWKERNASRPLLGLSSDGSGSSAPSTAETDSWANLGSEPTPSTWPSNADRIAADLFGPPHPSPPPAHDSSPTTDPVASGSYVSSTAGSLLHSTLGMSSVTKSLQYQQPLLSPPSSVHPYSSTLSDSLGLSTQSNSSSADSNPFKSADTPSAATLEQALFAQVAEKHPFDEVLICEEAVAVTEKAKLDSASSEFLMTAHKFPLTIDALRRHARFQQEAVSGFYEPTPRGAPEHEYELQFEIPKHRTDIAFYPIENDSFAIPPPAGYQPIQFTSHRASSIRTIMLNEMQRRQGPSYEFYPITLGALSVPVCDTKDTPPAKFGTTGMVEFKIVDAGDLNRLILGLTWDAAVDSTTPRSEMNVSSSELLGTLPSLPGVGKSPYSSVASSAGSPFGIDYLIPGFSPTSVGYDIATGCVIYTDLTGRKVATPLVLNGKETTSLQPLQPPPFDDFPTEEEKLAFDRAKVVKIVPYARPASSGSTVSVCVAYNRVYFIVDGYFSPPVPNLIIPRGVKIHALAHFGSSGIKLVHRCLTNSWTLNRLADGTLMDVEHNPLAHSLYLAELRLKVCPHYHAKRKSREARPDLSLVKLPAHLPDHIQDRINFINLAAEDCLLENCTAAREVNNRIQRIIRPQTGPVSSIPSTKNVEI